MDVSQKTDEDREFDKRLASGTLTSGPVEAKPSKKGSAPVAAGGTFASALALAGISVSATGCMVQTLLFLFCAAGKRYLSA